MKKGVYYLLLVLILIFLSLIIFINFQSSEAIVNQQYHLKLLAVQETEKGYEGSDADLYLELKEGSGKVYLNTYPLTKMDTQMSTRFAKEVACEQFKLNCDRYDFIYTIKAKSNIIGGPSAGAAISALTAVAMLNLPHDESIAVTGTINSGGLVGPVSGVKEKLEAASAVGLKKVLIAQGTGGSVNETNITENFSSAEPSLDLIKYGRDNLSLEVVEVSDLSSVVLHLTGIDLNHQNYNLSEDQDYLKIMQGLQTVLCTRSKDLKKNIDDSEIKLTEDILNKSLEKEMSSLTALEQKDYYSAASFCFSNNVILKTAYYQNKNISWDILKTSFEQLSRKKEKLAEQIDEEKIDTISDLQTIMIVKERLNDVQQQIDSFTDGFSHKNISVTEELIIFSEDGEKVIFKKDDGAELLAYAEERLFSAISWMQFFEMDGMKLIINNETLNNSCQQKISEAEERLQYANIFLGYQNTFKINEEIEFAKKSTDFELCFVKALQAKAEADALVSSLGVTEENFPEFLNNKAKAVERVIYENSAEGMFPIMGYSYYQYANSLKEEEMYTALIYLEYALEMSDLKIYFAPEESQLFSFKLDEKWLYLLIGLIGGMILTLGYLLVVIRKK